MKKFLFWKKKDHNPLDDLIVSFDVGIPFLKNDIVRILLVVGLFPLLASFVVLGSTIFPISIPLILRYNVYFGVSLLGDWWQVYVFPIAGIFLYLVHFLLAKHYYNLRERILSYLVLLASFFMGSGIMLIAIALGIVNF
jgi:hypothetical protein